MNKLPTPDKLVFKFEWFSLYEWDNWHYWLEMDGGEGMTIQKAEIMGFFATVWKRF